MLERLKVVRKIVYLECHSIETISEHLLALLFVHFCCVMVIECNSSEPWAFV